MKLAPIAFFAYNRPYHTIKSLECLQKNKLSSKSDIYIFIDGPKHNMHDKIKVKLVKSIVKKLKGFKSKKYFFRDKNFGLSKNFISGITQVLKKHEKVIVIEDDNLVSKYFLNYINNGLNTYKDDQKICGINGFSYPVSKKGLPNHFLVKGAGTWGWGTWRRVWKQITWSPKALIKKIDKKKIIPQKVILLKDKILKKNDSYTIMFDLSMQIKEKYSLVPKIPYSVNSGLDGTGRHAVESTEIYDSIINQKKISINKKKIFYNQNYNSRLEHFYKKNLSTNYRYKIIVIKLIKKILGKKILKKIKKIRLNKFKIDLQNSNNGKFINYLENTNYIKKNFDLFQLAKKHYFLSVRDGKLMNVNQTNFFILDKLKNLFDKYDSKLNIIEIGGGVGQKYLEFKKLIGENFSINWNIVEQKKYFNFLKAKDFDKLKFFDNFDKLVFKNSCPTVLIFSNSLQYIDDPYGLIDNISRKKDIKYLLIENIPLGEKNQSLIQRHNLEKKIFYSFQLFSQKKFIKNVEKDFKLKEKNFSQNIISKNSKISFNFYDLYLER